MCLRLSILLIVFVGLASNRVHSGELEDRKSGACSSVLLSRRMAEQFYNARGTEYDVLVREMPHFIRIRRGVPATIRVVDAKEKIFRHYTSPQALQTIIHSSTLRAGWTPFYYSGSLSDYNQDLTGVFLTTPEVGARNVGVRDGQSEFVDVKLLDGTGVLWVRDNIYLIPGQPSMESWKVDLYRSVNRGLYTDYASEFAEWDRNGIPAPLIIPVQIIRSSVTETPSFSPKR